MAAQPLRLLKPDPCQLSAGESQTGSHAAAPQQVCVAAADVLPLLVDAALTNRAWLEDFAHDTLHIPHDMYEVLLAYQQFRRKAA